MPTEQGDRGAIPRVTQEEFAPRIGDSATKLDKLVPKWGSKFVEAAVEAIKTSGVGQVTLRFSHIGENPQVYEAVISKPSAKDPQVEVELSGDWDKETKIPQGVPLIAYFDGMFYRKAKADAAEPIVKEGDVVEPNCPLGLAAKGKTAFWPYPLPGKDFPNGGEITKFICPPNPEGMEVVKGKTVICFVKKL